MRVAIVGSRNYPELGEVDRFVASLAKKYPDAVIVSGGAAGVDGRAEAAGRQYGLSVESYRPYKSRVKEGHYCTILVKLGESQEFVDEDTYYASFGRAAFARNRNIVEAADVVVAFTTGSKGTANSLGIAKELGKRTFVYTPKGRS